MKNLSFLLLTVLLFLQPSCDKPSASSSPEKSAPAETVRQLFARIQEGKIDDAIKLCTTRYLSAQGGAANVKSTFGAQTPKIKEEGGVGVEILGVEITGEVAIVTFNLRYGNGTVEPCKYRLMEEAGSWKHDGNA
jgi:hypothetical protein